MAFRVTDTEKKSCIVYDKPWEKHIYSEILLNTSIKFWYMCMPSMTESRITFKK